MERRSWPWRSKKSSTPKGDQRKKASTLFSQPLSPASSFNCHEVPPTVNGAAPAAPQIVTSQRPEDDARASLQGAVAVAEEKAKSLAEKLTIALGEVAAKEEIVKQQQKLANEAAIGWENAQQEGLSLKQELQACVQQKASLEERVAHLDGALKECMKQVRLVREEQEAKLEGAARRNLQELQNVKEEADAKQAELERRLMESEAQNSAMSRSLQERARAIVDAKDAKAAAETEAKVAQVKIESLEKEISGLKYELHVLNKELQIRNEEKEYSKKSSDAAHKQHLENVKKIAKLEADCQRLRNLVKKKLPGPAALAQMRKEVEGSTATGAMDSNSPKMRRRSLGSLPAANGLQHYPAAREIEMLRERMMSMEEETKLLKEALAKKNGDLFASRVLCAKTANKLLMAEDQLESVQGTPRESIRNGYDAQTEASVASMSDHDIGCMVDVEEASCAESWASALITELAQFKKKGKPSPCTASVVDLQQQHASDPSSIKASRNVEAPDSSSPYQPREGLEQLQLLNFFCKDVGGTLSFLEKQLRASSDHKNGHSSTSIALLEQLADAQGKVSHLGKAVGAFVSGDEERDANAVVVEADLPQHHDLTQHHAQYPPSASIRFVLCKLIFLIEMLRPPQSNTVLKGNANGQSHKPSSDIDHRALMQDLVSTKESVLEGKASIMEFLLRLGVSLSALCDYESSEFQKMLSKVTHLRSPMQEMQVTEDSGAVAGEEQNQLNHVMQAKAELEERLRATDGELEAVKSDLAKSQQSVEELQARIEELQSIDHEKLLAEEQVAKAELQSKLEAAELEVGKLQASLASLTVELADHRKEHERTVAKCEELELALQRYASVNIAAPHEPSNANRSVDEEEAVRMRKEREVAAAKEKLAECQRTILVLGKQLTALTSPPANSPGASFGSASILTDHSVSWDGRQHASDMITAGEEEEEDDGGGVAAKLGPWELSQQHRQSGCSYAAGGYLSPLHARASGDPVSGGGPTLPRHHGCPPAHHFHRGSKNIGNSYTVSYPEELAALQQQQHSAMSSPARSPARYVQQQLHGPPTHNCNNIDHSDKNGVAQQHHVHHPGVRTSLAKSMNRVASAGPPHLHLPLTYRDPDPEESCSPAKPSKPGGLGRLFSRSKNRS